MNVGGTFDIECIARDDDTSVTWTYKNSQTNVYIEKAVLKIAYAKPENSGRYTCIGEKGANKDRRHIYIKIYQNPYFTRKPQTALYLMPSERLRVDCSVKGLPKPQIKWSSNTEPIDLSTYEIISTPSSDPYETIESVFSINGMKAGTSQTIECVGYHFDDDKEVRVRSLTQTLVVASKPLKIESKERNLVITVDGGTAELPCPFFSSPPAEHRWSFAKQGLISGPKKRSVSEILSPHSNGSYIILNAQKSDAGSWKCVAQNKIGSDSVSVRLKVLDRTKIIDRPAGDRKEYLRGQNIDFSLKIEVDQYNVDSLNVKWEKGNEIYEDQGAFLPNTRNIFQARLRLANATFAHGGNYHVIIKTTYDELVKSFSILVVDKPGPTVISAKEIINPDIQQDPYKVQQVKLSWQKPLDTGNKEIQQFIITEYWTTKKQTGQDEVESGKEKLFFLGEIYSTIRTNLTPHFDYHWEILAVNSIGQGKVSDKTRIVSTIQKRPFRNPDNTTVSLEMKTKRAVNSQNKLRDFRVTWKPLERREFNGDGFKYFYKYCNDENYWGRVMGTEGDISNILSPDFDSRKQSNPYAGVSACKGKWKSGWAKDVVDPSFDIEGVKPYIRIVIVIDANNDVGQSLEKPITFEKFSHQLPPEGRVTAIQHFANVDEPTTITVDFQGIDQKRANGKMTHYKITYRVFF